MAPTDRQLRAQGRESIREQTLRDDHQWYYNTEVWERTTFLGVPCGKSVSDMWNYQEIIFELKPSLVVEFGAHRGGALFFSRDAETRLTKRTGSHSRRSHPEDRLARSHGWFEDTLATAPVTQLAVLRADGDMFSSTMAILDGLSEKVSPYSSSITTARSPHARPRSTSLAPPTTSQTSCTRSTGRRVSTGVKDLTARRASRRQIPNRLQRIQSRRSVGSFPSPRTRIKDSEANARCERSSALFVSQRPHRIDASGAKCGNQTGEESDQQQNGRNQSETDGVDSAHIVEQPDQEAAGTE